MWFINTIPASEARWSIIAAVPEVSERPADPRLPVTVLEHRPELRLCKPSSSALLHSLPSSSRIHHSWATLLFFETSHVSVAIFEIPFHSDSWDSMLNVFKRQIWSTEILQSRSFHLNLSDRHSVIRGLNSSSLQVTSITLDLQY